MKNKFLLLGIALASLTACKTASYAADGGCKDPEKTFLLIMS
ncbi:Uncharacterised protein [Chryseobacterium carnipullorum]|uniref:Lipoprotein n=1 Tax=Chryseobacterium carnipullorum TaxID=1124835 RepID=A0A376EDJ6_CHRCU|nr:Uncharacterised protein [Chryseobacterium carnipullorum]